MRPADRVVEDVSKETSIPVKDILGKSRLAPIVKARREAMRRLYEGKMRTPAIGEMFGCGHPAVLYHLEQAGVVAHCRRVG